MLNWKGKTSAVSTIPKSVVIDLLLETGGGGSGRNVLDLFHGLTARGWDVRLLLSSERMDPNFAAEVQSINPEKVQYFRIRRSPHPSDLQAIAQIRQYLSRSNTRHVLHAHSTKAAILGMALGSSHSVRVLTPHAYRGMDPTLRLPTKIGIQLAERIFSRSYQRIIAVSPDEANYIQTLGIDISRVSYIPNGVSVEALPPTRKSREKHKTEHVVGFLGRLVYQKNPLLFVDVISLLLQAGLQVKAIVVGAGPLRQPMQEKIASLGIRDQFIFAGDVAGVSQLGNMDVLVHTSRYESFPYALLEAAAVGTPIVSVRNAGSVAILGDVLPVAIVAEDTAESLAQMTASILTSPERREQFVCGLEKISSLFTIDYMVEQTERVYYDLLSRLA